MYIAPRHDVRLCSSQTCNNKSTSHRKNWRIQLRTVYTRSRHRHCFRPLACIQDMPLKKSGYRAVSQPVVSTTICYKLFKFSSCFLYSAIYVELNRDHSHTRSHTCRRRNLSRPSQPGGSISRVTSATESGGFFQPSLNRPLFYITFL